MATYIKKGYHRQQYCIWANDDEGLPLIVGTYHECAAYLGITPDSFLSGLSHHCYDDRHTDRRYPARKRYIIEPISD